MAATGVYGFTGGLAAVVGGSGSDWLIGPDGARVWAITGADAGRVAGVAFRGVENLAPGSGNNVFWFADGKGVRGVIAGGPGRNTLDYSAYTTPVTVNLRTGEATGTGGVDRFFEQLIGGSAADLLVGFTGYKRIFGNGGRDVLVGSDGAQVLSGGAGADLLIGGETVHDPAPAALAAIRAEWLSAAGYYTRIAHLRGTLAGGLNGSALLDPASLIGDQTGADTLTGGSGADWFVTFSEDHVTDRGPGERRTGS
jgi:Ca2+-binding RTX toxin-like protein